MLSPEDKELLELFVSIANERAKGFKEGLEEGKKIVTQLLLLRAKNAEENGVPREND